MHGSAGAPSDAPAGSARAARQPRARAARSATTSAAPSAARSRCAPPASSSAAASRSTRTRWRSPPAASSRARATPGRSRAARRGRRDYRLATPLDRRPGVSGTTAAGVVRRARRCSRTDACTRSPTADHGQRRRSPGCSSSPPAWRTPVTLLANLATRHLWGARASVAQLLALPARRRAGGPAAGLGRRSLRVRRWRACAGPGGTLYALADTYPSLGSSGVHLQPEERLAAAIARPDMPAGRRDRGRARRGRRRRFARAPAALGLVGGRCGTTARPARRGARARAGGSAMRTEASLSAELVTLPAATSARSCGDARSSPPTSAEHLAAGVGWVPANHALTPLGPVADPNPFGSIGDLRLLPDPDARVRVERRCRGRRRSSCCCATSSRPTARPGSAARGTLLRDTLAGARARARRAGARELRARVPAHARRAARAALLARGAAARGAVRDGRVMAALVEAGRRAGALLPRVRAAPVRDPGGRGRGHGGRRSRGPAARGRARGRAPQRLPRELRARCSTPRRRATASTSTSQPARRRRAAPRSTTPSAPPA